MRHLSLLLLAGTVLFFTNLGATRLWDDDEAIFSQAAWEMLDRGDYIVPRFNDKLFPDKPILMYWLIIGAYKVFGATEFAARFWSAIFGLGTVLLTYRLGCLLYSARVGVWAGLILASSLNFGIVARAATPDSLLIFFSTLALSLFVEGLARNRGGSFVPDSADPAAETGWFASRADHPAWRIRPSWRTWLFTYAAMGLAVLVKGPVGVVLPTACLGLFLLCMTQTQRAGRSTCSLPGLPAALEKAKRLFLAGCCLLSPRHVCGTIWSMRPLTALAVVAAIAGPWYAWVGWQTGGEWLKGFFGIHNFGRFFAAMENHRGPIYYYIPAILIGLFPWSVFLTVSILHLRQRIREYERWRPADVLVVCWIAVWVGFFSLASTKLPSYVLPAYPALALLTGSFASHWAGQLAPVSRNGLRAAWGVLAVVGVGLLVAMPIVAKIYLKGDALLGLIGLVPLVAASACFHFSERGRMRQAAMTFAAMSVMFVTGVLGFAATRVDKHQSSERFAEVIHAHAAGGQAELCCFGYFRPSLVFYAKRPISSLNTAQDVGTFFQKHAENAFLFTTDEELTSIVPLLPPDVSILEASPRFLKSKNILLLGRSRTHIQQAQAPAETTIR